MPRPCSGILSGVIAQDAPDPDIPIPSGTDMALQLEGQFRRMWSVSREWLAGGGSEELRPIVHHHPVEEYNIVGDSGPDQNLGAAKASGMAAIMRFSFTDMDTQIQSEGVLSKP